MVKIQRYPRNGNHFFDFFRKITTVCHDMGRIDEPGDRPFTHYFQCSGGLTMERKNHHYLLFFLFILANTVVMGNQRKIIPPVIVAAKKTTKPSLTSGPKTIITQEQLTLTGVTSLAEALQDLGGVQLQDTSGNGSQVLLSMRGFGANASSNTLLLVNGIPITNPDMAPPDLNAIPLQQIKNIEIVAGSESVLYGDQAVSGIINIITRQAISHPIELACTVGSYQQRNCSVSLAHGYQRLQFNAMLIHRHTDNYRVHNQYEQNILLGGINYSYPQGLINLDYTLAIENMQYPGALTHAQVEQNRRQSTNHTDFFKDGSDFIRLTQQQTFNAWRLQTSLVRREMHGNGVLFSPFTQSRAIHFLKPELIGTWKNVLLKTGMDIEDDRYQLHSSFGMTQDIQQKYGIFALATLPLLASLSSSVGLRMAQQNSYLRSTTSNNNVNRALATTLGAAWQFTPEIQFYLRRAGSFRFPKADENAATTPGTAGLKTQRGISYETGMEIAKEHYSAKLSMYQLNLRDEIAFDPLQTPQDPFGTNRNLAPTVRRGLTISGKQDIGSQLSIDGQYNYVNARFQDGINVGKRIPLVSENTWRTGINFHFSDHWNAYTEALFTGNQYAANDDANIAGKMGGYILYHFSLRYAYEHLTAALRINNIFNRYYYFYTVYQPSMLSEFFYPAPGRNFTLSVQYMFT